MPSLMNGRQTPHEIEARHNQLLGLEPELLILHEIMSDRDRPLHVSGVTTWVVQICCLEILNPRHKLEIPMCGDFKGNVLVVVPENLSMGVIP